MPAHRTLTGYTRGEMGRRSQYDTQGLDEMREEEAWLAENPGVVRHVLVGQSEDDDFPLPGERRGH